MLQILGGDRNVFPAHSAAQLRAPDKASIMHASSRDTVYLTVWKYKFGPASRLYLPCGYTQGRVVAVGKHPEVKAVRLLPCSSGRRVIFPRWLFKTAYFTFSLLSCPPPSHQTLKNLKVHNTSWSSGQLFQ